MILQTVKSSASLFEVWGFFLVYTFVDGWVMGLDHLKGLQLVIALIYSLSKKRIIEV